MPGPVMAQGPSRSARMKRPSNWNPDCPRLAIGLCDGQSTRERSASRPLCRIRQKLRKAPRLKKIDGLVDWSRPASAIKNQFRAMEPWPKTYTYWIRPGEPLQRLLIGPLDVEEDAAPMVPPGTVVPGTVLEAAANRLVVATGQGSVLIRNVQPAGKHLLSVQEFLCGHHVALGDRMGGEEESGLAETDCGGLK